MEGVIHFGKIFPPSAVGIRIMFMQCVYQARIWISLLYYPPQAFLSKSTVPNKN